MTINDRHFLSFIRYAIMGGEYPHGLLTEANWREQQKIAKDQTVSALLFQAVSKMPSDMRPPQQMMMKLYSYVIYYENMNKMLNERTCSIFEIYKGLGLHPILLKGQGAATLYKNPELRAFGDIDIFVPDKGPQLKDWVGINADRILEDSRRDHILAFSWQGATIENHLCLLKFYNATLYRRMEDIVSEAMKSEQFPDHIKINDTEIEVLPPNLSLLYLIVHFSRHLIQRGVGVRQLCDITMHIHHNHKKIDKELITRWFEELEMKRMACAVAAACVKYLGLPAEEVPFDYRSNEWGDQADQLMQLVMEGSQYGYWQKMGKKHGLLSRARHYLRHQWRIYPFMPREVRTEVWLKAIHRFN